MLGELLSMYVNGFTAFWSVALGGGLFRLVLIGFLIWWFFCRREGRCCCDHCGCFCGRLSVLRGSHRARGGRAGGEEEEEVVQFESEVRLLIQQTQVPLLPTPGLGIGRLAEGRGTWGGSLGSRCAQIELRPRTPFLPGAGRGHDTLLGAGLGK